tara:strand:+ start:4071 stop:4193 length:123 start_codon:yes stop_codon:yes gene_type:complete
MPCSTEKGRNAKTEHKIKNNKINNLKAMLRLHPDGTGFAY